MNNREVTNKLGLSDRGVAERAAAFCYYPRGDWAPVAWVIERLVLPEGNTGYTEEEMAGHILEALERRET